MEIALVLFVIAVVFITQSVKVVPQQHAWVCLLYTSDAADE